MARRESKKWTYTRRGWVMLIMASMPPSLAGLDALPQPTSAETRTEPIEFATDETGLAAPGPAWLEITDEPPVVPPSALDPAVSPLPTGVYNATRSTMTWLPGGDDRFGNFSLESLATLDVGEEWGLVSGLGFHFLNGPVQTDMPPRLFDFTIGYQRRELVRPNFSYDFAFRVGAFSDFEGSAKKGIRFPGHAVAFFSVDPHSALVLGVDYLDRDDISLLPVVGAILTPNEHLRLDAIFPRPRVAVQVLDSDRWLYVGGELGGGTWAVERVDLTSDNATYRDLRLVLGCEHRTGTAHTSSLEIGYVFHRELTYRSGSGDYTPPDAFMVRMLSQY